MPDPIQHGPAQDLDSSSNRFSATTLFLVVGWLFYLISFFTPYGEKSPSGMRNVGGGLILAAPIGIGVLLLGKNVWPAFCLTLAWFSNLSVLPGRGMNVVLRFVAGLSPWLLFVTLTASQDGRTGSHHDFGPPFPNLPFFLWATGLTVINGTYFIDQLIANSPDLPPEP